LRIEEYGLLVAHGGEKRERQGRGVRFSDRKRDKFFFSNRERALYEQN
jgi:hypothetical protein